MTARRLLPVLLLLPGTLAAQGYRLRLDARAQSVAYRGVTPDSVPASEVTTGPDGGPVSSEGYGVRCTGGPHCYFYRPGPSLQAVPLWTSASLVVWGLGVTGLSAHATARLVTNAGDEDAWPGMEPTAQLLEGYLNYDRGVLRARAGRLLIPSRLQQVGLDGAWARVRWADVDLDFSGYGGWGLAQAAVLPVTSEALNPLDEWRPDDRQIVLGAEAVWSPSPADVRLEYRRETDPATGEYVSERAALSGTARLSRQLRATGGAEWNIAEGYVGSADLGVTWVDTRFTVTAGGRRYRPFFSLWTLWGVFSPVPYNAVHGSAQVTAASWLTLRARGERYWYENSGAASPRVILEDRGWRASGGATVTPSRRVQIDAGLLGEFGPGASSRSVDATVTYTASDALSVAVYGGGLERPLELRYYDASAAWLGTRGEWRPSGLWRLWGDATWFTEERERPDPGGSTLDQVRLRAGVAVTFGTNADRLPLPPARRSTP